MPDTTTSPPWDQPRLTSLRKVAAELHPREADQRRIVNEAGLRGASIAFDASADNSWFAILKYANDLRKMDHLLDVLLGENEENELLQRIKADKPTPAAAGADIKNAVSWQGPKNGRTVLEKITGTRSALVPVSYLALGLQRARSVGKVSLENGVSGSGFLTGNNILITNHHVLADKVAASTAAVQFNYQQTVSGADEPMVEMKLAPDDFFETSKQDDWTAVRVAGDPKKDWGTLTMQPARIDKEDRINIVQHPGGGYKQISFFSNVVVFVGNGRVQYLTDTLPGSSGSPVFDRDWNVVALHHSGGWLMEPGSDSKDTFYRNEGILVDVILQALATKNVLA